MTALWSHNKINELTTWFLAPNSHCTVCSRWTVEDQGKSLHFCCLPVYWPGCHYPQSYWLKSSEKGLLCLTQLPIESRGSESAVLYKKNWSTEWTSMGSPSGSWTQCETLESCSRWWDWGQSWYNQASLIVERVFYQELLC